MLNIMHWINYQAIRPSRSSYSSCQGQQLAQYSARFTSLTNGTHMFLYRAQVLKHEVQFPSASVSLHSGFPSTHLLSLSVQPKQHCWQTPSCPLISQKSFFDSTHSPFLTQQPLQQVKQFPKASQVSHCSETFLQVPDGKKTHLNPHYTHTCSSQSHILQPGSVGFIKLASSSLHPPSQRQQPRQHWVHYPVLLSKSLHSFETGIHRLFQLKVHRYEHSKHLSCSQSQILHPRSVGASKFLAENSHDPSDKSQPGQHSVQSPSSLNTLQSSETGTQIASGLKTHLEAHYKHI